MAKQQVEEKKKKKVSILDRAVRVSEIEMAINCLFYGKSGTGKTTLASSFPGPVCYLDIREKGTGSVADVEDAEVILIEDWDDFEDAYFAFEAGTKYKTLVIDTASGLQDMCMKHVLESANRDSMTQQLWGEVGGLLKQFLIGFRDLPNLNVIFLAHDKTTDNSDEDSSSDQVAPTVGPLLMPSVAKYICAAVMVIGHTYIKEKTDQSGGKLKKEMQYHLRIGPHPIYTTKIRSPKAFEIPSSILNPTYGKLMKVIKGEAKKKEK